MREGHIALYTSLGSISIPQVPQRNTTRVSETHETRLRHTILAATINILLLLLRGGGGGGVPCGGSLIICSAGGGVKTRLAIVRGLRGVLRPVGICLVQVVHSHSQDGSRLCTANDIDMPSSMWRDYFGLSLQHAGQLLQYIQK